MAWPALPLHRLPERSFLTLPGRILRKLLPRILLLHNRVSRIYRAVASLQRHFAGAAETQRMGRERPGALPVRRTRTFRKCSFDARRKGSLGHSL